LKELKDKTPEKLIYIWKYARKIRQYFLVKRQNGEKINFELEFKNISAKSNFLLQFRDYSLSYDVIKNNEEKEKLEMEKNIIFENKDNDIDNNIDLVYDTCEMIINFVSSSMDIQKFEEDIQKRIEISHYRNNSFKLLIELMSSTKNFEVKGIILNQIKDILKSHQMKNLKEFNFHYLNNIENIGPILYENLYFSFKSLCILLINEINTENEIFSSGLLRVLLETLSFSIHPNDVEWILECNLIKKLIPILLFGNKIQITNKFFVLSSKDTEPIDIQTRAWRLFKIITLKCIEMLENWEVYQNNIQISKKEKIFKDINFLKDQIFEYLFGEMKNIIKEKNSQLPFIEEIILLFISLSSSNTSKTVLNSIVFKNIINELFNLNIPKIFELTLILVFKIFLKNEKENDDETSEIITEKEIIENDLNFDPLDTIDDEIDESKIEVKEKIEEVEEKVDLKEIENIKINEIILLKLFEYLGTYMIIQTCGMDIFDKNILNIQLNGSKKILFLLRGIFSEKNNEFNAIVKNLIYKKLKNSSKIITEYMDFIKNSKTTENLDELKIVFGILTLLNGFSYMPVPGETVKIKVNNVWEESIIYSTEEQNLSVIIKFKDIDGKYRGSQRIQYENLRVLTDSPLEYNLIGDKILNHEIFTNITEIYENINLNLKIIDFDTNNQLFLSVLMRDALKITNNWIKEKDLINYFLKFNKIDKILRISNEDTNLVFGRDMKFNGCTYTFTGKVYTKQYYYPCLTCGLQTNKAVCAVCAKTCHRIF
jgi:hypothetical protein